MNVGQQSLIRGSGRMTLLRLGLPLSSWRALKAHSAREGSPALFRSQRRNRAEIIRSRLVSFFHWWSIRHAAFGVDCTMQAMDQTKPTISRAMATVTTLAVLPRAAS